MENSMISKSAITWDKVVPIDRVGQVGQVGQKSFARPFPSAGPAALVARSEGWDRWDKGRPPKGAFPLVTHPMDQPRPGSRSRLRARRFPPIVSSPSKRGSAVSREEEIEGITVALDAILTALRHQDHRRFGDHQVGRTFAELVERAVPPTEAASASADLIGDPVGGALRHAIEVLGERLNELGGMGLMGDTLDRVSALSPEHEGWREHVLDRRWSGIGGWMA